jgi:hypothetical protein
MLSIVLWRWYINITITNLDIIHRPVFYLKHDLSRRSLKQRNVNKIYRFVTGNTLRLRYDPNRLMLSIGLWRWYINTNIRIMDIIHKFKKHKLSETGFCFRLQVEPIHLCPIYMASLCFRRQRPKSFYSAQMNRYWCSNPICYRIISLSSFKIYWFTIKDVFSNLLFLGRIFVTHQNRPSHSSYTLETVLFSVFLHAILMNVVLHTLQSEIMTLSKWSIILHPLT